MTKDVGTMTHAETLRQTAERVAYWVGRSREFDAKGAAEASRLCSRNAESWRRRLDAAMEETPCSR